MPIFRQLYEVVAARWRQAYGNSFGLFVPAAAFRNRQPSRKKGTPDQWIG
jgi:hypothetical protein